MFILLGIGAYLGFKKGMVRELLSFVAFIVAIVLGLKLMHKTMVLLEPHIGKVYGLIPFIAFLLVVILVIVALHFLGIITKKMLDMSVFGTIDSFIGAVLGIMIWGLCTGIILWIAQKYIPFPQSYTKGAFIYPLLVDYASFVIAKTGYVIPFVKDISQHIEHYFAKNS